MWLSHRPTGQGRGRAALLENPGLLPAQAHLCVLFHSPVRILGGLRRQVAPILLVRRRRPVLMWLLRAASARRAHGSGDVFWLAPSSGEWAWARGQERACAAAGSTCKGSPSALGSPSSMGSPGATGSSAWF